MGTKGFTIIEILLAAVILAVFVYFFMPRFTGNGEGTAEIKICNANIADIGVKWAESQAVESGDGDGSYVSLDDLLADTNYFSKGSPVCPFGHDYVDQNSDHRVDPHNHK